MTDITDIPAVIAAERHLSQQYDERHIQVVDTVRRESWLDRVRKTVRQWIAWLFMLGQDNN